MIQAFVSLKLHQPARTESGMRSFFEALQAAVFSQPTIFRSNSDSTVRPYSLDAVVATALNPGCKFIVIRAESEKFWQCTFLLPDKQGMGALFFDLQRVQNPRRLSPESLIEMFKKLYFSLSPRLIRIGDSEAREKLKSKHGLVLMPGIGRIEWLQIVSPEVYGDIYNPSELVAAPGYQAEILEDGALFLRVYDDPNEWESEDNISQANFIPGFLAGLAKIPEGDQAKERDVLRALESLWNKAEKTAERAYEALSADANNVHEDFSATQEKSVKEEADNGEFEQLAASAGSNMNDEDMQMRNVVYNRLKSEFNVEESNIVKVGVEGICTLFKVKAEKKPVFFATYQDLDRKVFILNNVAEDLSRFIAENGCSVAEQHVEKIKYLLKNYYHPEYVMLDSLDELPADVIRDRRVPDLRINFKPAHVEEVNGNQILTFWFYKPEPKDIETITLTQFEDWPLQAEAKVQCTDMENEPEKQPEPVKAEPAKVEAPAAEAHAEPAEEAKPEINMAVDPLAAPVSTQKVVRSRKKSEVAEQPVQLPAKSSSSAIKIAVVAIVVILIVVAVVGKFALHWF